MIRWIQQIKLYRLLMGGVWFFDGQTGVWSRYDSPGAFIRTDYTKDYYVRFRYHNMTKPKYFPK